MEKHGRLTLDEATPLGLLTAPQLRRLGLRIPTAENASSSNWMRFWAQIDPAARALARAPAGLILDKVDPVRRRVLISRWNLESPLTLATPITKDWSSRRAASFESRRGTRRSDRRD